MGKIVKSKLLRTMALFIAAIVVLVFSACVSTETPTATITLSKTSVEMEVGEEITLTATLSDDDGAQIVWQSINPSVAAVNENGTVRGISAGQTEIYAIAGDSYAVCTVTVKNKYSSVDGYVFMPMTSAQLKVGENIVLNPIVSQSDAVSWLSSSPDIATVNNGVVTGLKEGTTKITATVGSASADCIVNVVENDRTITLSISKSVAAVREGQNIQLTATSSDGSSVSWLSEDTSIATVSGGTIRGVKTGSVIISAWTAKSSAQCEVTVRDIEDSYKDDYFLVWSDEFDSDALDTDKWEYMLGVQDVYGDSRGPMFWGNNELQYYTEDAVSLADGLLNITATRQDMPNGREYSSARIATRDRAFWTYGYFEARMKTPAQSGMWPAFWMLPQPSSPQNSSNQYGGWPANGEIDIMEARGRSQFYVDTTLHFGPQSSSGWQSVSKGTSTRMSTNTEEWHVYALEWSEDHMSWFIDGIEVLRLKNTEWWSLSAPDSPTAPFDVDFYIILDLAVGGNYDGGTRPSDDFVSAVMQVDYVRVYKAV